MTEHLPDCQAPFLVDVSRTSVYALSQLKHVHHIDGSCFKNRYGPQCRPQRQASVQFAVAIVELEWLGLRVLRYQRERARHLLGAQGRVYLSGLRQELAFDAIKGVFTERRSAE